MIIARQRRSLERYRSSPLCPTTGYDRARGRFTDWRTASWHGNTEHGSGIEAGQARSAHDRHHSGYFSVFERRRERRRGSKRQPGSAIAALTTEGLAFESRPSVLRGFNRMLIRWARERSPHSADDSLDQVHPRSLLVLNTTSPSKLSRASSGFNPGSLRNDRIGSSVRWNRRASRIAAGRLARRYRGVRRCVARAHPWIVP